jgi:MazG family protein
MALTLTPLYTPTVMTDPIFIPHPAGDAAKAFSRFLEVIRHLRDPKSGCPWDLEQTFTSLAPQGVEEAYEVADAVNDTPEHLCEELGDLLSVIALYGQIGADSGKFSFETILHTITEKLIRRHPHVFGTTEVSGTEEVLSNWEAIKKAERSAQGGEATNKKSLVDGLPRSMPALMKAFRLGEKCARVGFDWPDTASVADKVKEEVQEFLEVVALPERQKEAREEFGDLLFSLTQMGRHLGINAEDALQEASEKFRARFRKVEEIAESEEPGTPMKELGVERLEGIWERVKGTK